MANKNSYTVENGIGYIHIVNNKGNDFEVIVDADIVDRLIAEKINLSMQSSGYVQFRKNGKQQLLHRWIMNSGDGEIVDHINTIRTDCRRENMRHTDYKGNNRNPNNKRSIGASGVKGVQMSNRNPNNKYCVRIRRKGYGCYKTIEEASKVAQGIYDKLHREEGYNND
ncbi:hypothetical protein [Bacillus anthracis]